MGCAGKSDYCYLPHYREIISYDEDVDLVTIVRGYFDDSADDKRKRFSAVGGLIGGAGQWEEFDKRWAVATYELTEPFHSTDCDSNPPRGGFKGWKKEDSG